MICKKCNKEKDIDSFQEYNTTKNSKTYTYRMTTCKDCKSLYNKNYYINNKEEMKNYNKNYYIENIEDIKQYRSDHKEEISQQQKEYKIKNKDKLDDYNKQYRLDHKEEIQKRHNDWDKQKRKNDPAYKLRAIISQTIYAALHQNESDKYGNSILKYLEYSMEELAKHLEKQFINENIWMNWNNYGKYITKNWNDNDPSTWKWNIDHINPQADLPYTSMEDDNFKECWKLSNLRPYSAKQNLIDGVNRVRHLKK